MPTMLSRLRRQWLEATSDWRKAPVCFSLGAALGVASALLLALPFCGSPWTAGLFLSAAERLHSGVDAPDNWALGITYWLYFAMGLCSGSVAFLVAGLWRAHRRAARGMAWRGSAPPDVAAGQVQG